MKDSLTYTYSIKVTGADDSTYTTPGNAQNIAANSYTFTGLTQGTNYTVRVKVNGDKANNEGTGTLANQTTSTVGGATGGLQTGNIVASKPTWKNGQASITLTTSTGMQIQWQKNGTAEGSWQPITSGNQITGLNNNDTVYARLTDGNNYGDYASITIKDTTPPIISNITTSNITASSITVTVTANDGQSGLATSGTYKYYLNDDYKTTNTTGSYTFTGLSEETSYTIKVEVVDKANNIVSETTTVNTDELPIVTAENVTANPNKYYGAEVRGYSCTSKGVNKWRIFYSDNDNIYLIADDYISYQYVPKGRGGTSVDINSDYGISFYDIKNDYSGADWISNNSKGKKWLNEYLNFDGTSTNPNIRYVAYLMDTNVWNIYAGANAEYAMGGPTIELFCASYKRTHQNKYIEYQVENSNGYEIKWSTDGEYGQSISGISGNEFSSIYMKSDSTKTKSMWIVSPSMYRPDYLMQSNCWGTVGDRSYSNRETGIRPIVCLKNEVQLRRIETGVYEIN